MQAVATSMRSLARPFLKVLNFPNTTLPVEQRSFHTAQVQLRYVDWKMKRDAKRRELIKEYGAERLRYNAIKRNTILPSKLREKAAEDIRTLPLDSSITRVHKRCIISSRPRGNLNRFRMSRIVWRKLADYNKLSGVTRSSW
ncbi:28S ribosomal protein S14, mitochondrial-like [Mizuhopecten yessoensis]|uniref:Small ribosomal subunit protein uS14 n=1 Tax=Mizuhopecten yessoensis TaxID=6573 RepID=A0A210QKN4_MIZYE|nr:28S ribosomal protein S14, mitochondrial-like [Mizuhopecten yessoensis]OWF49314.1 28S ribosomal protein S14, mitochondrial [Mizuhopecten yessoensis]